MAPSSEKRWIVLVQKTPRGPLTENEVKSLLKEGMIGVNDFGFCVPENEGATQADWKFLWQFPEFDRRKETILQPPPLPKRTTDEIVVERRVASLEEVEKKRRESLPAEILNLNPEDLIPHATSVFHAPSDKEGFQIEELSEKTSSSSAARIPADRKKMAQFIFAAAVMVAFMVLRPFLFGSSTSSSPNTPSKKMESAVPVQAPVPIAQGMPAPRKDVPMPQKRPAQPVQPVPIAVPKPREISEEPSMSPEPSPELSENADSLDDNNRNSANPDEERELDRRPAENRGDGLTPDGMFDTERLMETTPSPSPNETGD